MVLCPTYSVPEAYRENATCLLLFFFPCRINPFLFIFWGGGREGGQERFSSGPREKGLYF